MSNLIVVEVKFQDSKFNYETAVNGECSDENIRAYFVGHRIDLTVYNEPIIPNYQRCIDVDIKRDKGE